jgi:DNA helicase-2/ATP-dependent DNA helicase PcrA
MDYNPEQQHAIEAMADTIIVPAGPGSGKSRTLVGRVVHLVKDLNVHPLRIVILTFTNGGAHVFAERLLEQDIRVGFMGTLHSYCMRLIQEHGELIGYNHGCVSIATEEAKKLLLEEVTKTLGRKVTAAQLAKNEHPDAQLIWGEYYHRLKRANMVDYDGILRDGLALLKKGLMIDLEELLVDERQDSGAIDSEIYWEIQAKRRFFVGDVDQCIYAFRGSKPEIFVAEAKEHGCITLTTNYRSDIMICAAANSLIMHNANRIHKPIVAHSREMGFVKVNGYRNEGEELYGVWGQITELASQAVSPDGILENFNRIAVLGRTNEVVDKARDTLRGLGMPIKGRRVFLPSDWHHALSSLALMLDPGNDFHAEAVLLNRGHSPAHIRELKLRAMRKEEPLSNFVFVGMQLPSQTIEYALQGLTFLGVTRETMDMIEQRVKLLPNEHSTISDLLTDLWRHDKWDLESGDGASGVTVCTIHGAKGKEWDAVFVVGVEEGVMPSNQAIRNCEYADAESTIEEERRLAFVAITRARHRLILSHSRERTSFFKTTKREPSRFITEMGIKP